MVTQEPFTVRIKEYELEARSLDTDKMPLVLVPSQAEIVIVALKALNYEFKQITLSGYEVLYDITAPHLKLTKLGREKFTVQSDRNPQLVTAAADGDLETRWGSGEPQRPGEQFTINFSTPQPISGFEYFLGHWGTDYARGLSIRAEYANGETEELINPEQYKAIRFYSKVADKFSIFLKGKPVKRLVMTQTGQDALFDWSIAEINLFVAGK